MNKNALFSIASAAVLAFSLIPSAHAAELLLNGNFETPVQTTLGDHTNVAAPTNWTTAFTAINLNNPNNIVRGPITGTGATTPLPVSPQDPTGLQSYDGNGGDVYLSQNFTLTAASLLRVAVSFGGRDSGSATGAASFWQILTTGGTVLATGANVNPTTSAWTGQTTTTPSFAAGTYTLRITLRDADMVDAVSVQNVPEPSTFAAAGIGAALVGWMGFKRRRA